MIGVAGTLHSSAGGVGAKALVRVISTQGCAIEAAEAPGVGKKCELYMDWRGTQIGVQAQVVSTDEKGRIGLKFLSVDKDTQNRLSDLCDTLRSQPRPGPRAEEVGAETTVPASDSEPQLLRLPEPPARSTAPPPIRERRRVPRYVSELRARLSDPAAGDDWRVTLITLSVLGGCVEGAELPPADRPCEVKTEWEGRALRLPGEVVWKSKEGRVGVKFASLDAETEKLLRLVCANLRLQPLAPLPPEPDG